MNDHARRYLGYNTCTTTADVIMYLKQNYVDSNGTPMPHETTLAIVQAGREKINRGIGFRSNVYYVGDEAVRDHGEGKWTELPEPDEDEDEDEDGQS